MSNYTLPDHVAHGIYIGGARMLYHAEAMRDASITHVLKLYEDTPNWDWPIDFTVCNNTVTDGEAIGSDYLRRGVAFVREQIAADNKVLVACGAGISRSSTFVLAALLDHGYKLPEAWRLLKESHPVASPHPELWKSLIWHYQLSYSLEDVMGW